MNDIPTSEKIVGLFATFRENETEIERMEVQLREKAVMQDKAQRELDLINKSVTQKEAEHHRLRRVVVKAKESANAFEPLLAKGKEAQFMVYTSLVEAEDHVAKIEQDHVENQLKASRELMRESDDYLRQRGPFVNSLLKGLQRAPDASVMDESK